MQFGLVVTNQSWLDDAALAAIDATRFHTLNVVDHPAFPIPDPWTWLAYAAARTSRIRLGTHVTGAPFHHPQNLARQVATVDVLSGGRATLGIGTAYEHGDFEPYGYPMPPFARRVRMLEESIRVMISLWTQESTEFAGEFYHLAGGAAFAPKPVQRPGPPIYVGLNTAGLALAAAARVADGVNTWQLGPAQLKALLPGIHAACAAAGRDIASFALTSDVLLARGATAEAAGALAGRIAGMARSWGRSERVTQWDAGGVLHGEAGHILEQARAFAALGVTEFSVAVSNLEDIQWFDRSVIARFRDP
jgi:alkanesulfonate monooxygenase SsuD/methylene tetrahydromethanopterin reductase-like flavin-dependent oxidoreductase (luciferase family)